MQHPKVVLIGAGSIFFGRQAIWQMVHSPHLKNGTLALVDTQPVHLARMSRLAQAVIDDAHSPLRLETSTDRRDVLKDADFVVLSFANQSVRYRRLDCHIALEYGIRMCSGDTIGPGGIMRTLRELPAILDCCRDVERLCPNAWVINYVNPTSAHGKGIRVHMPHLRSFALCDSLHMPHVKQLYAAMARVLPKGRKLSKDADRRFDLQIGGPNHFTWILRAAWNGHDVTPAILESLRQQARREQALPDADAKERLNASLSVELYDAFQAIPTCIGHTKEYVRFWQGLGTTPGPFPPLAIWEDHLRSEWHANVWNEIDAYNYGLTPIPRFHREIGPDHAGDVIETMWAGLPRPFYVNTDNRAAVPNMPNDAFLELLCDLSMDSGPVPRPVSPAPVGLRGLWQQVLDAHECAARAAASGDRDLLLRAFACDPLCSNLADARAMIERLLDAERDALPTFWFKRRTPRRPSRQPQSPRQSPARSATRSRGT